jgi:hypothetical protein
MMEIVSPGGQRKQFPINIIRERKPRSKKACRQSAPGIRDKKIFPWLVGYGEFYMLRVIAKKKIIQYRTITDYDKQNNDNQRKQPVGSQIIKRSLAHAKFFLSLHEGRQGVFSLFIYRFLGTFGKQEFSLSLALLNYFIVQKNKGIAHH